jgi:RNA polymerase primary sigma factor
LVNRDVRGLDNPNLAHETRQALATLSPREEMVIRCGFGIGVENSSGLNEVGRKFSLTPAKVRHLQARAFQKLRQNAQTPWPKRSGSL